MSRLKTRDQRNDRALTIAASVSAVAVFVGVAWVGLADGWPALAGIGIAIVVALISAWVNRWIDTGRWFR